MRVIKVRNVQEALPEALHLLRTEAAERESRYGDVLVVPQPVTTMYTNPKERVIFWPERDANPFLHFFEGLWMLGGRDDVAYIEQFAPKMREFSDDGETLHGAYGNRWRNHFRITGPTGCEMKVNQILNIVGNLIADPTCRRQVLAMWDPAVDLVAREGAKDLPCNTHVYFGVSPLGSLDMTVCNRSNDVVWGCYGSDMPHFSMLQEVVAAMVGVPVGFYWHMSNNWHGYLKTVEPVIALSEKRKMPPYDTVLSCPYVEGKVQPLPMVTDPNSWFSDLEMFLDEGDGAIGYKNAFFRKVAIPMLQTHRTYKQVKGKARYESSLALAGSILAPDWRLAVEQWITRRYERWNG